MEVTGKIKKIGDIQTVGSQGFQKRELVIVTNEQYPQFLLIEFVQDKCSLLDHFRVDESVRVNINLQGREWRNPQGEIRYFNSIRGWKIDSLEGSDGASFQSAPSERGRGGGSFEKTSRPSPAEQQDDDDLPF